MEVVEVEVVEVEVVEVEEEGQSGSTGSCIRAASTWMGGGGGCGGGGCGGGGSGSGGGAGGGGEGGSTGSCIRAASTWSGGGVMVWSEWWVIVVVVRGRGGGSEVAPRTSCLTLSIPLDKMGPLLLPYSFISPRMF